MYHAIYILHVLYCGSQIFVLTATNLPWELDSALLRRYTMFTYDVICFLSISHIIQLTPQELSVEPRNSASAEALAVARRPKEASREKTRPPPV